MCSAGALQLLMTAIELRDKLIELGIASIREHETRPERIRGGLGGFELCRLLDTPDQYIALLQERHAEEVRLHREGVPPEEYWEYRYATLQIEFVWERVRVALRIGDSFSARAVLHVNELLNEE